ncbi:MAG: cation-translocating P-type ATPase [Thermoguttaceae bacterium]|jgi:Ca2+-transporting ATPase
MSKVETKPNREIPQSGLLTDIDAPGFTYSVSGGLSNSQAEAMRRQYGRNALTPPPKIPWWKELLSRFSDPTIRILLVAALISLGVTIVERSVFKNSDASYFDSIGIFLAVGLATLLAFFSERKSGKEFELLNRVKDVVPIKAFRNGQIDSIPIVDIVVGDIAKLDTGDKIPADGVLIDSSGIQVNESMLTGESEPVRKEVYADTTDLSRIRDSIDPANRSFLARGTAVVDGSGLMLVLRTGDETQMGKIALTLGEQKRTTEESPLMQKLARLAKQISVAGVIGALTIFTVMLIECLIQTPLLDSLREERGVILPLIFGSLILGLLLGRFGLHSFFAGMGIEIHSLYAKFLVSLPFSLALFTVGLGLTGTVGIGAHDQAIYGIALLKEVLMAFVVAVTIIVVTVPEGLPMMVTLSLALNMRKMVKENCLVRRLVASETIGSATVICTDKTGTLTENQMKPELVYLDRKEFSRDNFADLAKSPAWERLIEGIALNASAMLHFENDPNTGKAAVTGIGNVTESALLLFLYRSGVDIRRLQSVWSPFSKLGYNSDRKMSLATGRLDAHEKSFIKGAPERILPLCSTAFVCGREVPIAEISDRINESLSHASGRALRLLAFAEKFKGESESPLPQSEEELQTTSDFRFIGFVGLADPLRPEAADAVEQCRKAHIHVKMITGDSRSTAEAIAAAVGIPTDESGSVLTSAEFAEIPDEQLAEAAERISVLARATPFDKLRLVNALHRKGEVVAMTGDGINDAPALKAADVGISMGKNGTEVAKEASDIVLLDDNFKSIVTGVWWGRTLFQNIRRFVQFQLSVNAAALLCALLGPILHVPLPLTVTQLLWINIIMDTFAALALSTEPPRPQTLTEKPLPRNASIITGTMGVTILTAGIYQTIILYLALFGGWFVDTAHRYNMSIPIASPEYLQVNRQALTVFFTIFVMFQFWHTFNCRALRSEESGFRFVTPSFLFIVGTIVAVQIVMVQIPWVGEFFRTEPLTFKQWFLIILLTFTIIPAVKLVRLTVEQINKSRARHFSAS